MQCLVDQPDGSRVVLFTSSVVLYLHAGGVVLFEPIALARLPNTAKCLLASLCTGRIHQASLEWLCVRFKAVA